MHGAYGTGIICSRMKRISDPIIFPGFGAFSSPFASTYFSTLSDRKWAFHFIISAGLAVINVLILTYVFRFRRQEGISIANSAFLILTHSYAPTQIYYAMPGKNRTLNPHLRAEGARTSRYSN